MYLHFNEQRYSFSCRICWWKFLTSWSAYFVQCLLYTVQRQFVQNLWQGVRYKLHLLVNWRYIFVAHLEFVVFIVLRDSIDVILLTRKEWGCWDARFCQILTLFTKGFRSCRLSLSAGQEVVATVTCELLFTRSGLLPTGGTSSLWP